MQYIALVHNSPEVEAEPEAWSHFFKLASASGLFKGGSAMDRAQMIGSGAASSVANQIGGFMRFDADDLGQLKQLLQKHPVVLGGGSIELFEMPVE